jgi:iron(III) transport system ATP-binding protein
MSAAELVCRGIGMRHRRARADRPVLADVDVRVAAGTSLVLLGSSGAGKTTLLRVIAGLEEADTGEVLLGGEILSDPRVRVPPEHRRIGMVFQALELWPHMSVAEHLAFGLPGRPRGRRAASSAAVRELADQVGLPVSLLGRRPDTLSGGEQQRVAIARTIGAEPDVILYDEPLANLDPDRRRALRALIRRLARERGTTLVYVTHDPDEAVEIGAEIAVMDGGRILERGAPQALYRSPRTLAGARALGPVTALRSTVRDGVIQTALGSLQSTDAERLGAVSSGTACLALLRPEDVRPATAGGATVTIEDVVPRARDWAFRAALDGEEVLGRSDERLELGARIRVAACAPAALVPGRETGREDA